MLIALADRAGRSFPLHAHTQGFARWKGGGVSIEEETSTSVVAKVRGERTRDVVLEEKQGCLLVRCSCPARTFELPGCKHAWATLLEVDRRGALPNLRATRAPLPIRFLEPSVDPKPQTETPPKKAKKPRKAPARDGGPASPRSPRATSAPPPARGKPRRRLHRASARHR